MPNKSETIKSEETIRNEIKLLTAGEGNKNYCIKAGAGAGKTTILSERISRQLIEGIPIESFVVITYTNTAASELHAKIAKELNEIVLRGTEPECTRAKEALSKLDLMQISTIHSFLFNILREFSFEAGVAMDVQMLDNDEEEQRRIDFFNEWYMVPANKKTIRENGLTSKDWIIPNSKKVLIDQTRNVYLDTFCTLSNIRDEIVYDPPISTDEIAKLLDASAREVLKVLVKLKEDSTVHDPCSLSDYGLTVVKAAKPLYSLIGKELKVDDIENISSAYDSCNAKNKFFNEISNKDIPGGYPEHKKDKHTAIKKALEKRDKKGDEPILALAEDAKELMADLIYLCDNFGDSKNLPLNPKPKYSINSDGQKLNAAVAETEHLLGKPNLEFNDVFTIWKLFCDFRQIKKFLNATDNDKIEGFDYPSAENSDFLKIDRTIISQMAVRVIDCVINIQKDYQAAIDKKTRKISNDDILYRSMNLLENHPDILEKLRNRYSKIYVDEFQDTTPIQTKIMEMLSSKSGTPADEFRPDEDKLFVVGDPKQSIYRFTGADKNIFEDLFKRFKLPDIADISEPVELNDNYRSNTDIVDWVNNTFDLPSFKSDMRTDWKVEGENVLHGVFQFALDETERKGYSKAADIAKVVELVEELVDNPKYKIIGGRSQSPRTIRYSDITIVFKKTTHMDAYLKAFTERPDSIPVTMRGKFSVDEDEIMKNFVILLDLFANPKNETKKIAAAQVLCGVDCVRFDNSDAEKKLFDTLKNTFLKNSTDVASIVQYLFSRDDLYLPYDDEGPLEIWKIRKYKTRLHQMIETCLESNDGNLRTLVDLMREYLDKKVEHEIELERNSNAVKFINVHKIKGMSEQIVIIADRNNEEKDDDTYAGFRATDSKYYPSASYAVNNYGNRRYYPTFYNNDAIRQEAERRNAEDLLCLEYVAATRARNALIIMPVITNNVWFTNEIYDYSSMKDIRTWMSTRSEVTSEEEITEETKDNTFNWDDLAKALENERAKDNSSLSDATIVSITPSGLELKIQTGYTTKETGYKEELRPANNVFGTVMHRVFELLISRRDEINDTSKEDQIARAINQAILESYNDIAKDDERCKVYFDYLHEVLTDHKYLDKVLALVKDSEEVYTEFAFSFFVSGKDEFTSRFQPHLDNKEITIPDRSDIWVNGKADLVVKTKDGLVVYDYKSDKRNGKPLNEFEDALYKKYAGQLELYKYAIGTAFGVEPDTVKTELIHLYLG